MKKILLAGLFICCALMAQTQVQNISVKQGLELQYIIYPNGQVFPVTLRFDWFNTGDLSVSWKNSVDRGGKYIMTRAALDSATTAFWGPPQYDQEITLDADQTMLIFSKKQWNELQKNKKVDYDGTIYIQKPMEEKNQLLIEGKPADALFLESENGKTRIWLLNNPEFPILLKLEQNPFGVDLQIERLK